MEYTLNKEEAALIADCLNHVNSPVIYKFYETILNDPETTHETKHHCLIYFYNRGFNKFIKVNEEISKPTISTLIDFILSSDDNDLIKLAIAFLDQIISRKDLKNRLSLNLELETLDILRTKWALYPPHQRYTYD